MVNKRKNEQTTVVDKKVKHDRKHGDLVEQTKRLWNQLRLKTNTPQENRKIMDELFPIMEGKICDLVLKHDAARVVQAAIQYGSPSERLIIVRELTTTSSNNEVLFAELAKNQYAHFCVLKVIKYCCSNNNEQSTNKRKKNKGGTKNDSTTEECVKLVVKALKGHITKLMVHAVACRCIASLFQTLTPKQTAVLKQEWYGPHVALFVNNSNSNTIPTLKSSLEQLPDKRDAIIEFVQSLISKGMDKSLYGFAYFQQLLFEYHEIATPLQKRTLVATGAPHLIHLLSSRIGTKVATDWIAYGTAKDRRAICKCLKGFTMSGMLHKDAYLAIMRLVQLTDDTVSIQKNILNEIISAGDKDAPSPLIELALSDTGSKLLLLLLSPATRNKYLDPYESSIMFENPTIVETDGTEAPTSKKEETVRRDELQKVMKAPIIESMSSVVPDLLKSIPGGRVLVQTYAVWHSSEIVQAVSDVMLESAVEESDTPIWEDRVGQLNLKNLILSDEGGTANGDNLALTLLNALKEEKHIDKVASSNRGSFVLAAIAKVTGDKKSIKDGLDFKSLTTRSKNKEGATAGFAALMNELK